MTINKDDVAKIAHLARLSNEEINITDDLSKIIKMVEQISTFDTTGVTPMAHPLDTTQILREDLVTEPNNRDEMQALTAETEAGLYLVPQVIEEA